MTNQTVNVEPLKNLKKLLVDGNIAEILNYVRGDFAFEIDSYIEMAEKVSQTENDCLQLQIDYAKSQIESAKRLSSYEEFMKKINASINQDLEEME